MIAVPEDVEFIRAERAAAGYRRADSSITFAWGEIIATAQRVLGEYQANFREDPSGITRLIIDDTAIGPLVAAARMLESAAASIKNLPRTQATQMLLLAGCAYAMYGNLPSAEVVFERAMSLGVELSDAQHATISICAPRLSNPRSSVWSEDWLLLLERDLHTLLHSASNEALEVLDRILLNESTRRRTALDVVLLNCCRIVIRHLHELAVVRALAPFSQRLPAGYAGRLAETATPTLLPPQLAILQSGLLESNDNAILSLPTSTGKTLLGELVLAASTGAKPGLVCFVAPYIAIGRQVADSLKRRQIAAWHIRELFAGFEHPKGLQPDKCVEFVVATPERLDLLFRVQPDLLNHLRAIVFDEAHCVQVGARGMRLEGLITRLRIQQERSKTFRIALLSAVLADTSALRNWMGLRPNAGVFSATWRPTARRLAVAHQPGPLRWYPVGDALGQTETDLTPFASLDLEWPESPPRMGEARQREKLHANVAFLAEWLFTQLGGPVLCVCHTRDGTRSLAYTLASSRDDRRPGPKTAHVIELINAKYKYLGRLCTCLGRGVAFHNASLPHEVRAALEDAIRGKEVDVVAATTTLAEGVDLPFRSTIVVDWMHGYGNKRHPMRSMSFRNIAGRCGRAGMYSEGDTVLFENTVGEALQQNISRWHRMRQVLASPAPLDSSLVDTDEDTERGAVIASLGDQVLAAIPENPDDSDIGSTFASLSLCSQTPEGAHVVQDAVRRVVSDVQDETKGALARAASPLKLTPLGEAARVSGCSPESARRIATLLGNIGPQPDAALISKLLESLGDLPECSVHKLATMVNKPRTKFVMTKDDLERIVAGWLRGTPLIDLFAALPRAARKAGSQRKLSAWIAGTYTSGTLDSAFDEFHEFMEELFVRFLPWLLRTCEAFADALPDYEAAAIDWNRLQVDVDKQIRNRTGE